MEEIETNRQITGLIVEMEKYDDKDDDSWKHHNGQVNSVDNIRVDFPD